jgi:hypothetical protein
MNENNHPEGKSGIPPLEQIEYWLAKEFNYRQNIVVPNVSWGLQGKGHDGHECDLLILRPSGYAVEIEIKRSFADLKAEAKKRHRHESKLIRELWFSVPVEILDKARELIPERAGLLTYEEYSAVFRDAVTKREFSIDRLLIRRVKSPKANRDAVRFSEKQRQKLLELAHMRIWTMKRQIARRKNG